jgi:hypothetical protein
MRSAVFGQEGGPWSFRFHSLIGHETYCMIHVTDLATRTK